MDYIVMKSLDDNLHQWLIFEKNHTTGRYKQLEGVLPFGWIVLNYINKIINLSNEGYYRVRMYDEKEKDFAKFKRKKRVEIKKELKE